MKLGMFVATVVFGLATIGTLAMTDDARPIEVAMSALAPGAPGMGAEHCTEAHAHAIGQFGQSTCPYCGFPGVGTGSCRYVNGRNYCTYSCVNGHRWEVPQ